MASEDIDTLRAFRSEVPLPDAAKTEAIYQQVVASRRAGRRFPTGRMRLAVALLVAAMMLSAGAFAAVTGLPWWKSGSPPVDPQAVASVAKDNLPAHVSVADARTVATDGDAALVAVPLDKTGYCLIPAFRARANFGAQCIYAAEHAATGNDDIVNGAARPKTSGDPGLWLVYGRITDPRARTIDLGALSVKLENGGFFIVQIPSDQWQVLGGHANPGRVLDASGQTIRRGCVSWGSSPATPAPQPPQNAAEFAWGTGSASCRPVLPPAVPTIDYQDAERLFDVTLTQNYSIWKAGETITFFAASATEPSVHDTCVVAIGPGMTLDQIATTTKGLGCTGHIATPPSRHEPLDASISAQLAHVNGSPVYVWSVAGTFDPRRVASVKLQTPRGETATAAGDGFFFGQFPETTPGPSSNPAFPSGQHWLIGYDNSGKEVTRIDLNAMHERSTPH